MTTDRVVNEEILLSESDDNGDVRQYNIPDTIDQRETKPLLGVTSGGSRCYGWLGGWLGYAMCLVTVVCMAASLACTQALDESIPHSELNVLRFATQFILIVPFLAYKEKCNIRIERPSIGWLVFSGVLLTIVSYCMYGAAYYLPVGVIGAIYHSLILVLNVIIQVIVDRILQWHVILAVVTAVVGVFFTTQPSAIFGGSGITVLDLANATAANASQYSPCAVKYDLYREVASRNHTMGDIAMSMEERITFLPEATKEIIGYSLIITLSIVHVAYMQIVNRKLPNFSVFVYNFWVALIAIVISLITMFSTETVNWPSTGPCWFLMFAHMLSAGALAIMLFYTLQLVSPVLLSLVMTMEIAILFVLQFTVFVHIRPGNANVLAIIGATLVVLGNAVVPAFSLWNERKQKLLLAKLVKPDHE